MIEPLEQRTLLSAAGDPVGSPIFTDFGPGNTESGGAVAVLANGKMIQVGVTTGMGPTQIALARFNADGTNDNSFGPDMDGSNQMTAGLPSAFTPDMFGDTYSITAVKAVAVNPATGQIIVVGIANNDTKGDPDWLIAAFDADGNLDSANFGTGGVVISNFTTTLGIRQVNEARAVAIQEDGKIIVAGSDKSSGSFEGFTVARYNSNGSLDDNSGTDSTPLDGAFATSGVAHSYFGINFEDHANAVAIDGAGNIIVAGTSRDSDGSDIGPHIAVRKYNSSGVAVDSVREAYLAASPIFGDIAYTLAVDSSNRIVVAGNTDSEELSSAQDFFLIRYDNNLDRDGTFGFGGLTTTDFTAISDFWSPAAITDLAIQSDGNIVAGGGVITCNTSDCGDIVTSNFVVARYSASGLTAGQLDGSFSGDGLVLYSNGEFFFPDSSLLSVGIQNDTANDNQVVAFGSFVPNGSSQDFILSRYTQEVAAVSSGETSVTIDGTDSIDEGDTVTVGGTVTSGGGGGSGTAWLQYQHHAGESEGGGGGTVTSVIIDWGDGSAAQEVAVTDGEYSADHQYVDDNASDTYTVTVTAGEASAEYDIIVSNVAPSPTINGAPASGPEGTAIPLTSSVLDPGADTFTYAWSVTKNGNPYGSPVATPNFTFTPNDNGIYVVTLTVTDDDGGANTTSTGNITVNNVAPSVAAISGPATGVRLFTQNFSSSFADPGTGDTWTVLWNFGDGNTQTSSGSPGALSASHVYAANGTYTVTLTVTDDDTGSDSKTKGITIVSAAVISGTLQVGGLAAADNVTIKASGSGVNLNLNGASTNFSGFSEIFVISGNGADTITVNNNVTEPVVVFAGAGADSVKGGGGDDILIGDDGPDLLQGNDGRDLLIGGDGADKIVGMADDDILVAGYTSYDLDAAALNAILSEWTSARSYGQRSANILNENVVIGSTTFTPTGPRNNGSFFLKPNGAGATVSDDGDADVLTGSAGRDLFLFNADGPVKDKITDLASNEFAADLDFIASVPT